jgi:hypothetical protein
VTTRWRFATACAALMILLAVGVPAPAAAPVLSAAGIEPFVE